MPKEPWEWDETDLLSLVSSQAQESLELEHKASGALDPTNEKKSEISKGVRRTTGPGRRASCAASDYK